MPLLMEQAQALPGNNIYSDSIGPQSDTSSPLYILPNPQESQPPTTDKLLWSYNTVDTIRSSPVVADGVVYFTLQNGYVFAVNASTATPIWSFDAQDGIYSSPIVEAGVVYICTEEGYVYALNATSNQTVGEVIWSYNLIITCMPNLFSLTMSYTLHLKLGSYTL